MARCMEQAVEEEWAVISVANEMVPLLLAVQELEEMEQITILWVTKAEMQWRTPEVGAVELGPVAVLVAQDQMA